MNTLNVKKTIFRSCLALGLLLSSLFVHAQIGKGMKVLSGNASYSGNSNSTKDSISYNTSKNNSVGFSPSIGYFITDKLCIGLSVPFSYSSSNSTRSSNSSYYSGSTATKQESIQIGLSPYMRYYMNITDKLYAYLTAQAGVNINTSNSDNTSENFRYISSTTYHYTTDGTSKGNGYGINGGIQLGLTYFVTPKFAIESNIAGLTFNHNYSKSDQTTTQTNLTYPSTTIVNTSKSDEISKSDNFYFNFITSSINLGISYYFK